MLRAETIRRGLIGAIVAVGVSANVVLAQAAPEVVKTVCAGCHGEDGNGVAPTFPKLAGQHAVYLEKQLTEYLSGKRKTEMMAGVLPSIKKGEIAALAAYFSGQKIKPAEPEDDKLIAAGKRIYIDGNTESGVPACSGCHVENGEGNDRYPRVSGQYPAYTRQQMLDFKSGARTNDKGKVMRAVAERMTEAEIKSVAEYLAVVK